MGQTGVTSAGKAYSRLSILQDAVSLASLFLGTKRLGGGWVAPRRRRRRPLGEREKGGMEAEIMGRALDLTLAAQCLGTDSEITLPGRLARLLRPDRRFV